MISDATINIEPAVIELDLGHPRQNVRFGSKADICAAKTHVRFPPNSDRESGFPQTVMSALPPRADMCGATRDVRFGPCVDVYGPRPIATGRRDQVQWSQLLTYIRLLMRPDISSPRAPMDFRALPPQRPPDIGRGHAGPHTRFGKRRNDRFAISCHFVAIAG